MGKAIGGGVYSLETDIDKPDPNPAIKRIKVDLESVEFKGHMKPNVWNDLRDELVALQAKYSAKAPNLVVTKTTRKSK